jgi:ATP-binding cassette, subfamily B, bacterial
MGSSPPSDLALTRRLLRDARPFWPHLAAVLGLALLSAPLALLTPLPLKIVVDHVLGDRPLPAWLIGWLPGFWSESVPLLGLAAAIVVLAALLQNLEGYASWYLQLYVGEKLSLRLKSRLFAHVQRLSLAYHDRRGTADSMYRIQHDAPAIQFVLVQGAVPLLASVATVLAMLGVMIRVSWPLAVVAVAVIPVLFIAGAVYRRRARAGWEEVKRAESAAMATLQETLGALRVVKSFGQEEREVQRHAERANRGLREQLRVVALESGFGLFVAAVVAAGTAAVLYLGVRQVQAGQLTLGSLLLVLGYLAQIYKPLETVSKKIASLQGSLASAARAYAVFDETPDVAEPRRPRSLVRARGDFRFERVEFAYASGPPVWSEVSLEIPAGARVGISGPTGAGKTTLVSLLPRFLDPTGGRVLLDGADLREYGLADLRRQFGIVLQEPVLFSGTVADNIRYGRPGASRAEIEAAAAAANALEFIERLPHGFDTFVGERGMTLSGGERQRVSLARAFLKDAPVLILDEPTSAVDTASEAVIVDAMERLMAGRTTFMIAHRLNTLERCTLRLRCENGRVCLMPPPTPQLLENI